MSKYRSFKGTERAMARRLGGKRTGHLGGQDIDAGNEEARSFLLEFRGNVAPTLIPYGRQQRNATQRWAFDETEIAQKARRLRL